MILNRKYNLTSLSIRNYNLTGSQVNSRIDLNFCYNIRQKERKKKSLYGNKPGSLVWHLNESSFINLAGPYDKFNYTSSKTEYLINEKQIKLTYPKGDKCIIPLIEENNQIITDISKSEDTYYQTTVYVNCEQNKTEIVNFTTTTYEDLIQQIKNNCDINLIVNYEGKCIWKDYYIGAKILDDYYILFLIIFIIFGGYFSIFSGKFYMITSILGTACFGSLLLFILIFNFLIDSSQTILFWVIVVNGFILGGVIGFIFSKYNPFCTLLVILMSTGYCMTTFLNWLFIHYLQDNIDMIYWITMVISFVCFISFAYNFTFYKFYVLAGSSFCGTFMIIRGLSIAIGGVQYDGKLIDLHMWGEIDEFKLFHSNFVYLYLTLWVIATIIMTSIQYKLNSDVSEEQYITLGLDYKTLTD